MKYLTLTVLIAPFFLLSPIAVHAIGAPKAGTSGGQTIGGTSGGQTVGGTSGGQTVGGTSGGQTVGGTSGDSGVLVNPLKVQSLEDLLNLILDAVIQIGRIVLILMLVWTGFLFVTAQGKEEKIRSARAALFWTIIGGLILLGAKGLSLVIESTATNLSS